MGEMQGEVRACVLYVLAASSRGQETQSYIMRLYLFSHHAVTSPSDDDTHSWNPNMIMHFFFCDA